MHRASLLALIAALGGCATAEAPPEAPELPGARHRFERPDIPPNHRPGPFPPYSSDLTLLAERTEEAIGRWQRHRWEVFREAVEPGEMSADIRVPPEADQRWKIDWLFRNGDELFEHEFTFSEGYGPGISRVHRGTVGPDALSCAECHRRGGFDGAGDLSQNAFFDGDGYDPASGFERNPPHTLGLGLVQKLAEEITEELIRLRDIAQRGALAGGKPVTLDLHAKGLSFGSLTAKADGTIDLSKLEGVSPDLVVRPFGWKGSQSNLRAFAEDGLQRHHGLQSSAGDPDADGRPYEISEGMLTTLTVYLSLLEMPVMIPPEDPVLLERHARGHDRFHEVGCAGCHTPTLPLDTTSLKITDALHVDVVLDAESPTARKPDVPEDRRARVPLFSDLKRHAMGPGLAESRPNADGVPADVFLTRPLWGLADTAPYLHDGRAVTIDEAILAHGGEAKASRDAFEKLPDAAKGDLRIFLLSLTRYPRIDFK